MKKHDATLKYLLQSFFENYPLLKGLVIRDIKSRYNGSYIGVLWSIITPIVMLAIYTFVFSVVFKAKWGVDSGSKTEFALVLFAGMIMFNLFSECIARSTSLIIQNANYVKKVVFPLEILVPVCVGSALFNFIVSFSVWIIAYVVLNGIPPITFFLFPLILLPFIFFVAGVCWLLSALSVFIRDIAQFINIIITVLLFMSPVFYPVTALPENYRHYLFINPLTYFVETFRAFIFFGQGIDIFYPICFVASLLMLWMGFFFFQKTRKGFADVI
ncbi:ABC transporter permease [Citrobacter sp.]|uniref:ABC transporter permease n=1 Tax=Citrobacter sp. TaxID=1896336 RepID=UPI002FC5D4A8